MSTLLAFQAHNNTKIIYDSTNKNITDNNDSDININDIDDTNIVNDGNDDWYHFIVFNE